MSSTRFLVESRESRKQKEDTRQAQFIWQSRNQLEKWISRKWETKSSCINYQEIRSANWNNWVSLQIPRHCQFRRSLKWSSCAALWKCLANECAILCHFSLPLFFFLFFGTFFGPPVQPRCTCSTRCKMVSCKWVVKSARCLGFK